jgi:creatinine amidohydrolase
VHMGLMSWVQFRDKVAGSNPVVLIPVGSVEQHGPHLPLSTDSLIPTAICETCARDVDALVAPTLSYGYKSMPRSGGGQHFCGTTSLDASTLIAQIKDIVRDLTRHGVRKLAFVVGHMENQWFVNEACDLALREARMLRTGSFSRKGRWMTCSGMTFRTGRWSTPAS